MGPEMTILECICQVVVFWAVCLVGWVTVKIIECHGIRHGIRYIIRYRISYRIRDRIRNGEGRRAA